MHELLVAQGFDEIDVGDERAAAVADRLAMPVRQGEILGPNPDHQIAAGELRERRPRRRGGGERKAL
jgi:hypothetical protein